ncbi:N-acetyl-gamma-glutamyl-phosphate reductase [Moheibacter sediminis]|uniref:N-acetyl-gamma-glutamyl-phosphate reductase n=1 Tax=Moheibacter sediminis TaxID=1434700 RepID=A0A1W2BHQ7_9FLAO|nr:N-acetyl-gamma-glutamyl-phosphate reductase [Moheibacter sediminis]SMC72300.1 N-acetyl-gamma-glutamyl-phosphate reductase [Moheibacter sediminis]
MTQNTELKTQNTIKASIVGGAGYTAGELLRILINHPHVEITSVYSTSNSGNPITKVHDDLLGETNLIFSDKIDVESDLVFLCLGHGKSFEFLAKNKYSETTKFIDLSNDFRAAPKQNFEDRNFVYGLPELNRDQIISAQNIANPGCFATAIQLAILPLAEKKLLHDDIHINAVTGSTGAGQSLSETSHFSWRNNNASFYKEFSHQHEAEIYQSIYQLENSFNNKIYFLPMRGDFTRGILAGVYLKSDLTEIEAIEIYKNYYKEHPFTIISDTEIALKQVVNTNKCLLQIQKHDDVLLITSIIDNLTKGASGQAVQNMNLMFGFKENLGLNLKSSKF